jgi:hypothetical protein
MVAEQSSSPAIITMLREMEAATQQGIDFKFELYRLDEKSDPINFEGQKWNTDIMFMFAHFRVKPSRVGEQQQIEPGITIDADVIEETELPQLPRGKS